MPCLKLSPLQSRFAASLAATLLLIALYLILPYPGYPGFAYAIDVDSIIQEDHNHPISVDVDIPHNLDETTPESAPASNSESTSAEVIVNIARRAPDGVTALENNAAEEGEIGLGETHHFMFPREALAGPKSDPTPGLPGDDENEFIGDFLSDQGGLNRQNSTLAKRATTVYISANVCSQPSLTATREARDAGPPQLQLYVSRSEETQQPGPGSRGPGIDMKNFAGGHVSTIFDAEGDLYIGISAPRNDRYSGKYKYEIAASIDQPFHKAEPNVPYLFFVDGDSGSALLQTNDTTQTNPDNEIYKKWMSLDPPPFTVFAHNINDSSIIGLENSFCGLKANAQIRKDGDNVQISMTNRGDKNKPKEQFYIKGLNKSSSYYGFLAMEGNSTKSGNGVVGGGGKVWKAMNFTTKAENNCALIHNLDFCSDVAYAVPSNPSLSLPDLIKLYDTHAASLYKNFSRSLAQIPCNTDPKSQYSLARSCNDCAAAYKQWLCAVTIPRCADYSSTQTFLRPRNVAQDFTNGTTSIELDSPLRQLVLSNSSRNPMIDEQIKPGPYKEVLPCQDLCHELVQNCPAALGFSCPEGRWLNASYGAKSENGDVTCSYLGAAYFLNGVGKTWEGLDIVLGVVVGVWALVWML